MKYLEYYLAHSKHSIMLAINVSYCSSQFMSAITLKEDMKELAMFSNLLYGI